MRHERGQPGSLLSALPAGRQPHVPGLEVWAQGNPITGEAYHLFLARRPEGIEKGKRPMTGCPASSSPVAPCAWPMGQAPFPRLQTETQRNPDSTLSGADVFWK